MKKIYFDYKKLEQLVSDGEVLKNKHPVKDLFVYSYNKVWYPEWTDELKWSRGLVLNSSGDTIACPFHKFFNYSEVKDEVDKRVGMKYKIQDKADGSLGILFWYEDQWILCTRGSFTSTQAIKGKEILDRKYPEYVNLNKDFTYLFEIIYPENQIVLTYKEEKMILIAVMTPEIMREIPLNDFIIEKVLKIPESIMKDKIKVFDELTIDHILTDLARPDYTNSEGFVVVYDDGYRVKYKYEEYVRLHRIVSDFKPDRIIEVMRDGGNIDEVINSLPDEFRQEIIDVKEDTLIKYSWICMNLVDAYIKIRSENKKEFALKCIEYPKPMQKLLFELWKQSFQDKEQNHLSVVRIRKLPVLNKMIYNTILAKELL